MSLLSIFQWLAAAPLFDVMRNSKWGFASVEMLHLVALTALGGAILIGDLAILGIGLSRTVSSKVGRELAPLFWMGLAGAVVSGALLVSAEAMKCYYHPAFRLKMLLFVLVLAFYLTLHRRAQDIAPGTQPGRLAKLSAVVSLTLWLGVGLAGRAIGFL
ncbi:DUF6644 family protein [Paludibaculum fermentans]|uniref:DUF6644 domain-containing protein n=1 Tax=Paludibaculum fermentans TaxID=1473598 RepID=A0A7S7NQU9_PALFE|nr:DUF6644 family protein [Paludibaculum fermentans]QOY88127.1 hypothetical protein IRI77_36230 [Paludibaculum fermentans]